MSFNNFFCLSGFIPVVYSLIYMHVIIEVLMGDAVNPTHMGDTLEAQMALLKGRVVRIRRLVQF